MMTDELTIDFIWHRAVEIPGQDGEQVRMDNAGAIIRRDEYNCNSEFGWKMVPVFPLSKGGVENYMSLLPYHIKNAEAKGDDYPLYETVLSSEDMTNVPLVQKWNIMKKL